MFEVEIFETTDGRIEIYLILHLFFDLLIVPYSLFLFFLAAEEKLGRFVEMRSDLLIFSDQKPDNHRRFW